MKKIIKMLVLLMFLFVPTLVFADTKIELVRATGGNQPRFGQTIDNNWVAYDSEAYTVNSVSWDSTASHNVGDYFEPGEGYVLTISYTPKDGFYFEDASLMQATINDLNVNDYTVDSIVSGGVGGNDRIVQYSFDDILPYLIHSVELGGTVVIPDYNASIPTAQNIVVSSFDGDSDPEGIVVISDQVWQYKTGDGFYDWHDASGVFEGGKTYHLRFMIEIINNYYAFDSGAYNNVTINGMNLIQFQFNNKTIGKFSEQYEIEPRYEITYDYNGGTHNGHSTEVFYWVPFVPIMSEENLMMDVIPPVGKALDAVEIDGVRRELGYGFEVNHNATVKYLWKDATIKNVVLASDGTLTFSNLYGNYTYWLGINHLYNSIESGNKIVNKIQNVCNYEYMEGVCGANNAGDFTFELFGQSESTNSVSVYGIVHFDGTEYSLEFKDRDSYILIFHTQGGSPVAPIIFDNPSSIPRPNNPTKEGKVFGGWYTDSEYNHEYGFNDTSIGFVELYAKWNDFAKISSINITGVNRPIDGQVPVTTGITTDTPGVSVRMVNWYAEDGFDHESSPVTSFVSGKRYIVKIDLELEDGYEFSDDFEDNIKLNVSPLKTEFVKDSPDIRAYYEATTEVSFPDVPKTSWYYESVKQAYNNNIILGYSNGNFGPNDKITRGQLVTILWRMEHNPDASSLANPFSDVKEGQYYTDGVKWAFANKIVSGYGGTTKFGPNDPIIRQDLAVILNNYAKYKGIDVNSSFDISTFADYNKVQGKYAEPALKWAAENAIMSGQNIGGKRYISPYNNTTRAEAAAMIINYRNKF